MKKEVKENLYLGDRTGDSLQKSTFTNPFVIAARNKKNLVLRTSDIDPDTSGITNEWTLDTAGNLTLPAESASLAGNGFIKIYNGYQTLLAYGSDGIHGGPELDWMDCDNLLDFNAPTTLRNTLYLNDDGLYIGINENNVSGINEYSWQFDTNGNLTLPVGGDILDENGDSVLTTIAGDPRLTIHGYLDGVTVPGTAKNFITFTTGEDPISALYLTKFISVDNRAWFAIQVGSTWTASQAAITSDLVAYGHFGPNATLVNTLGANLLATTGYTLLPETSYTMWIQQINAIAEYAFSTSPLDQGGNEYTTYSNVTSTPTVIPFYTSIGDGPVVKAEDARLSNATLEGETTHSQLVEAIRTKTGANLTVVHDFKTSSTWYHSTISQDFTPNFTNIPTDNDRVIPLKLIVANGATPYKPLSPIKIAGIDVAVTWEGGVYPTGTANLTTVWTYNLVRNAGTWKVFGKAELYTASTDVGSRAYTHSPTFTGIPAAPTALKATDTTQIATTAYVKDNLLDYSPIVSPTFTGTVTIPSGASISGFALLESPTFTGTVTIPSGASISGFALLESPTFTGTPIAPTALKATNTTQVATTAYVKDNLADYAVLATPTFTGTPLAPTATAGTTTTQLATTAFVGTEITNAKASPTFTGTPLAPTADAGTNTTQIATTEFVKTAVDNLIASAPAALNTLDELAAALGDDQNYAATITTALSNKAPIASPTFTGLITDSKGELRNLPQNAKTAAYTLVLADAGKHISITTGGVTVPAGVFAIGDSITIYNNSASNQTITTSAVTCYLVGTATTGARTLAQRGLATLICVASDTFVITGGGLT